MEQISIAPSTNSVWKPVRGLETEALLKNLVKLSQESKNLLLEETLEILSNCTNPKVIIGNQIGLAYGYVQSGKTMSFTMLTALAKDNGFPIIIVLAGVTTNLVDQSYDRLKDDLQIGKNTDSQWLIVPNPNPKDKNLKSRIKDDLEEWEDETIPQKDRRTILFTVMKHKGHIPNLTKFLKDFKLTGIPVLVIDDEGDQHSMDRNARQNAKKGTKQHSTIHRRLLELKDVIPNHSFIQYTATPQAPLFIEPDNNLSPNFIQLLTPGPEYTGGKTFFREKKDVLTKVITDIEEYQESQGAPPSLVRALQIFFLGVVKGWDKKEGGNRTMMVHPSQLTYTHSEYERLIKLVRSSFLDLLSKPDGDRDKNDLLDEFKLAYDELKVTTDDLPPFDVLTSNLLKRLIRKTVIGGAAMDRGFTVEGLTVTYMPRSMGVGNVDTIQQRARFFGYKKKYLGYCRVYLDKVVLSVFEEYIVSEEEMRSSLRIHKEAGKDLNDWYRQVFLRKGLNLSRRNIFSMDFERAIFGGKWTYPRIPHFIESSRKHNVEVFRSFLDSNNFSDKFNKKFLSIEKPLLEVYQELLIELKFNSPKEEADYSALLYVLEKCISDDAEVKCTLFLISDFDKKRGRSLRDGKNEINELFQGRNDKSDGIRDLKGNGITFQLYVLDLFEDKANKQADIPKASDVPVIATFIPQSLSEDMIRWAN
jgi:Z1 domain